MTLLQFMGEHYILTFFLAMIIGSTFVGVAKALGRGCDCKCRDEL